MCCNRRNRNHQPLAVKALQVASEKYHERQQQRQVPASSAFSNPSGTSTKYIKYETTAEPPSYEAVINDNRAAQRATIETLKASAFIDKQKSLQDSVENEKDVERYQSWWQQKKAEKAARKAEKWAEKARERGVLEDNSKHTFTHDHWLSMSTTITWDATNMGDAVTPAVADKTPDDMDARTHRPASKHDSRLQLLDIAQELQDLIYEHTFSGCVSINQICMDACYDACALLLALRTNSRQYIFRRAEEIYYKTARFKINQEHLVPWLKKRTPYTKHIKRIRVTPTNKVKEEDGRTWMAQPCNSLPYHVQTSSLSLIWLSAQTVIDSAYAERLQTSVLGKMHNDVRDAGITIGQNVLQVPVELGTTEGSLVLWTEQPVEQVVGLWNERMKSFLTRLEEIVT